jgi:hypothetical protein
MFLPKASLTDVHWVTSGDVWGPPDYVTKQIITQAEEAGAETILVSMNRGAMPHEMFLNQIRRFGKQVLPHLQAHEITRVPLAEAAE